MTGHHRGHQGGFVQHTLEGLHDALDRALSADRSAQTRGLLQRLDPRVKVAGMAVLILACAMASKLWVIAAAFVLAISLALISSISVWSLVTKVWLATLTFSGALALPALFITPGTPVYQLPIVHWEVTRQGLTSAAYLVLRAETSATLAMVLVFTTPWAHVLKALRMFRVPVVFVVILGMACRYILLLLETTHEMFESRKSRTVGALTRSEQRRIAIQSTGALLSRTVYLSDEVFLAMQSRGFRGEVHILDDFRMKHLDWLASSGFAALAVTFLWMGR
ncbi:MAG: cobalt ECF transporter T component CbiQ [Acidobacteriota bacterium]